MDETVKTHNFTFNKIQNGGESVSLETTICHNGDGPDGIFYRQKLKLQSYCNSASMELVGSPLTPDLLRQLAHELEVATLEAKESVRCQKIQKKGKK